MTTITAALALLATLTLGETARVASLPVTRSTLLGYTVAGGECLTLNEAAAALVDLTKRVRLSVVAALAALAERGDHGRVRLHPEMVGGVAMVRIYVTAEHQDRVRGALRDRLIADGFYVGGGSYDGTTLVSGAYW